MTRRVLPKGAGRVCCLDCAATAAADGKGTPITLRHSPSCPNNLANLASTAETDAALPAVPQPDA